MSWDEDINYTIEYIWRKYSTIIIFSIITSGFLAFIGASWYQKKITKEETVGSLAFKAISSKSTMSIPLREKNLQKLINNETNYKQFATMYLANLYYQQDANNPEVKKLYNAILNDKKVNKIVKNFAAQRLAYIALSENDIKSVPQYITILKKNNFPLSAKQIQIFYNITIGDKDNALQLIEEINDSNPATQEMNTNLKEMLMQQEIITPYK